jgi:hypothetical protein
MKDTADITLTSRPQSSASAHPESWLLTLGPTWLYPECTTPLKNAAATATLSDAKSYTFQGSSNYLAMVWKNVKRRFFWMSKNSAASEKQMSQSQ